MNARGDFMPFDGVVTHATVNELIPLATGGRINKIYQPTDNELIITFRNKRKNHDLLLSIHPMYARFHITNEKFTNPKEPPMFCMVLRKHLIGGFIEDIEQVSFERIVKVKLNCRDEIGDMTKRTLLIEIMGRHSNIILINNENEQIIDAIKHISPFQNRHRAILPGQKYIMPPKQDKINPLDLDKDNFSNRINFNQGKIDRQIVQQLMGFSPFLAKEITHQAHLGSDDDYNKAFNSIKLNIKQNYWRPTIYTNEREDFHVVPISYLKGDVTTFPTISAMLDEYFTGKAERDRTRQQAKDLTRFIRNELDKNKRKTKRHRAALKKAERADDFQKHGELLTAHMHEVKQGDSEVTVIDYYDPEQKELTIKLDRQKSPSQNAQQFFKTYQKLKNSKQFVKQQMQETEQENQYFEQLLQQIELAREEDIEEIREELIEGKYLRRRQKKQINRNKYIPKPEKFTSSNGVAIYVGRNNKQNDYLTTRLAHRNDVWLHTKDIPGSHVVIRDKNPSDTTILEAAQLAVLFSKASNSSNVPVDYTHVRHVSKPSGSKPGFVTYDNHQTVFVTPEQKFLNKLKMTEADN